MAACKCLCSHFACPHCPKSLAGPSALLLILSTCSNLGCFYSAQPFSRTLKSKPHWNRMQGWVVRMHPREASLPSPRFLASGPIASHPLDLETWILLFSCSHRATVGRAVLTHPRESLGEPAPALPGPGLGSPTQADIHFVPVKSFAGFDFCIDMHIHKIPPAV